MADTFRIDVDEVPPEHQRDAADLFTLVLMSEQGVLVRDHPDA